MSESERAEALKAVQLQLFELKREYAPQRRKLNHLKLRLIRGKGSKRCRKCDEVMDADQFYKDLRYADGLYPYCRECQLKRVQRKGNVKARKAVA